MPLHYHYRGISGIQGGPRRETTRSVGLLLKTGITENKIKGSLPPTIPSARSFSIAQPRDDMVGGTAESPHGQSRDQHSNFVIKYVRACITCARGSAGRSVESGGHEKCAPACLGVRSLLHTWDAPSTGAGEEDSPKGRGAAKAMNLEF